MCCVSSAMGVASEGVFKTVLAVNSELGLPLEASPLLSSSWVKPFGCGLDSFIFSLFCVDGDSAFLGGLTVLNFVGPRLISVLDSLGMERITRLLSFFDVLLFTSTELLFCGLGLLANARIAVL